MTTRHFLSLQDVSEIELKQLVARAIQLKDARRKGAEQAPLRGKVMAMIFEKSSTRTRVSFEAGMAQLGGSSIFLSPDDTQLGRGEPIEDSARIISSMVDVIMVRTFGHERLERFADYSSVPVINALTDSFHPCQLLADIQTYTEHRGSMEGIKVAWVGDGNNMCNSYINASALMDFQLSVACPVGYEPDQALLLENADRVTVTHDPSVAIENADLVVTDTWASMGQEEEKQQRIRSFSGFQVNETAMENAAKDALFMHCLPAYRGLEISDTMLESRWSVVWDEAENRLHAQKALLEFLFGPSSAVTE